MKTTVYGLHCEYERQHVPSIVISGDPPLERDALVPLEEKMLLAHRVPRLLPLEFEQVDRQLRLRYDIAGKRPLADALRSDKLSLKQAIKLLYAIVTVLDDSKSYMLCENRYLLDDAFLYVGRDISDVHLLYVPLKELPGKENAQEDLRKLTRKLTERVDVHEFQHNRTHRLLDYLKGPTFHWTGCKQLLLAIWDELELAPAAEDVRRDEKQLKSNVRADNESGLANDGSVQDDRPATTLGIGGRAANPKSIPHKTRTAGSVVAISLVPLIWYAYAKQSSEGAFLIALGATLLCFDALFLVLRLGRAAKTPYFTLQPAAAPITPAQADFVNSAEVDRQEAAPRRPETNLTDYYERLPQLTTLLSAPEGTVLLTDLHDGEAEASDIRATLVRVRPSRGGETANVTEEKEVAIVGDSFVVGRSIEAAHYVLDEIGISRMHIEIVRAGNRHAVRDLGSKNSSFLNGDRLVPYDEYELQDGDRITIARAELIYRAVDSRTENSKL